MIVYIENFFIAYCGKIRYLFSQHLFAPPPVLLLLSPAPASASSSRLSRPDIFSAPLAPASSSRLSSPTSSPRPSPHRHLLRAYLAPTSSPRLSPIGIFFAPFSPYLPLAAAFRIISPFCCKKNRDFADLTLDKRDSADYLFKRLQFFAGLYYV